MNAFPHKSEPPTAIALAIPSGVVVVVKTSGRSFAQSFDEFLVLLGKLWRCRDTIDGSFLSQEVLPDLRDCFLNSIFSVMPVAKVTMNSAGVALDVRQKEFKVRSSTGQVGCAVFLTCGHSGSSHG